MTKRDKDYRMEINMSQVTVPKTKYEQLKKQAAAYRLFAAKLFESVLKDPVGQVVEDFRKTNLYTEDFIKDLESGLRKSSYIKKHGTKAS